MRILVPVMLLGGLLAGCASLTEDECHIGNWEAIGTDDAVRGLTEARYQQHVKACLRYDIVPDRQLYDKGYAQGLLRYCTPTNGFSVGRNGYDYRNICPADAEADFLRGYERGNNLHIVESDIAEAKKSLSDLQIKIGEVRASDPKDKKKVLRTLQRDADRLEDEIYRLNRERDRALLAADRFLAHVSPEL